jgi:MOSC domain-containing protein YiiM
MQTDARLVSIVYKPKGQTDHDDRFTRVPVESAQLVAGYGIENDRKGGHPRRQINIMSQATLDALAEEGYKTDPGEMGEQMIASGIDLDALPVGTRLQLGDQAVIEVTTPRTGCDRFAHIQGFDPALTEGRLGVLVRVIEGGTVRVGDPLKVVKPDASHV